MDKVAIHIPVYGRLKLTRLCYKGLQRLIKEGEDVGVEWIPMIGWHEQEHRELAEEFGFKNFECTNATLGDKNQALLEHMMGEEWDWMVQMGSDDFMYKGFSGRWKELASQHKYFRFQLCDMYNLMTREYNTIRTLNALGRTFHRDIITRMGRNRMWMSRPRGCDTHSDKRVWQFAKTVPHIVKNECAGVDIKTGFSVTPWKYLAIGSVKKSLTWLPEWKDLRTLKKELNDIPAD